MPDRLKSARYINGMSMQASEGGERSCKEHQAANKDRVKFTLRRPIAGGIRPTELCRGFFLRRRAFFSSTAQTAAVSCAPSPAHVLGHWPWVWAQSITHGRATSWSARGHQDPDQRTYPATTQRRAPPGAWTPGHWSLAPWQRVAAWQEAAVWQQRIGAWERVAAWWPVWQRRQQRQRTDRCR
jgi:hypothetical protein